LYVTEKNTLIISFRIDLDVDLALKVRSSNYIWQRERFKPMKRAVFVGMIVALLCSAFSAVPAKADTFGSISLTNCGTLGTLCPPATYSFSIGATSATLTITIDGTPISGANHISSVDLGFTPSNNITLSGAVVFKDNGTTVSGLYNNTFVNSINSSGDCSASGHAAFVCASSSVGGALIAKGDVLTWTWNYTLGNSSKIDAQGDVHIGANYGPNQGIIVSTTVPEPDTITLLLVGLFGVGFLAARLRLAHT
jgi:hypothetical protein